MAQNRKTASPAKPATKNPAAAQLTADDYFNIYNQAVPSSTRVFQLLGIPVALFGLFALMWAIPFPHIKFLGQYNGFVNWASFLLAFMVYFYLRLRPSISYLILLFLLICAYGVTELLAWQVSGGPQLWLVALIFLVLGAGACMFTIQPASQSKKGLLILAAPLWETMLLMKSIAKK